MLQLNTTASTTAAVYFTKTLDNTSFEDTNSTYNTTCWGKIDSTHTRVLTVLTLTFFIVGVTGNILSFLVFSSKDMISMSSHIFLLVLSVSDTGYLISTVMSHDVPSLRCIFHIDLYDPFNMSSFWCKLVQFTSDLFANYSTCIIVCFTIERFIAVYKPTYYKSICTSVRAKFVCFIAFVAIGTAIFPYHYLFIELYTNNNVCSISPNYTDAFGALYTAEVIAFRITPVLLVAVLNITIAHHFRHVTMTSSTWREAVRQRARREETSRRLTKILLLVSTTYVITYLPSLIHFIVYNVVNKHIKFRNHPSLYKTIMIWRDYCNTLYIFGFSINFFLYTVSGPMFRQQLWRILSALDIKKCWLFQRLGCVAPRRADSVVQTEQTRTTLLHDKVTDKVIEVHLPQCGLKANGAAPL